MLKAKNAKLQNKFDLLGVEQKNLENTYEQYKNDIYDYKVNNKKEKTELLNETNDLNLKLDKSEISLNDCKKQLVAAKEAFQKLKMISEINPTKEDFYNEEYTNWKGILNKLN